MRDVRNFLMYPSNSFPLVVWRKYAAVDEQHSDINKYQHALTMAMILRKSPESSSVV